MKMKRNRIVAFLLLFLTAGIIHTHGQVQVSGDLVLIGRGMSGESYEGSIRLDNIGDTAEEVRVYLKDFSFSAGHGSSYKEPGTDARSNASWIDFFPNILNIAAGARAEIGYRVRIPEDEELTGTYWSMLFVEGVPEEKEVPESEGKFTLSITQVVRYGIQLITEIGDTGHAAVGFENPALHLKKKPGSLELDVVNTGSLWLMPSFSCTLFNLSGIELSRIEAEQKRLYPGTSTHVVFGLPELDPGRYRALVLADGGGEKLFGANYTLEIEE